MGFHTMTSQTNGKQSQIPSLSRQNSIYNLTLDEVQSQLGDLGKPITSMNLDELLKNVYSVESCQTMEENTTLMNQFSCNSSPQSMGVSGIMKNKTVDEVWSDIQKKHMNKDGNKREKQGRQPTLGEMILEDFLVKAGVVVEGLHKEKLPEKDAVNSEFSQEISNSMSHSESFLQHHWMPYQLPFQQQQNMMNIFCPVSQAISLGTTPFQEIRFNDNQMPTTPSLLGNLSDTQTPGSKRVAPGDIVEKTVERRHKRMIKNRESAARSRARKQAYTNELENKVSRLEAENEKLKKQKVMDNILYSAPPPKPKHCLRRTGSSLF